MKNPIALSAGLATPYLPEDCLKVLFHGSFINTQFACDLGVLPSCEYGKKNLSF
jgi:hypothetical protein